MASDKDQRRLTAGAELRRRAEERLRAKTAELHLPRTKEAMQRLVHELEVHQLELEMQNEELRQARDEREKILEKYTDLYDFAPVGYFTLDRDGTISAVNLTGAALLGIERSRLLGRGFGQFIATDARPAFTTFLDEVFSSPARQACEVALRKEGDDSLFVQIEAVATASGQACRAAIIDISVRRQLEEKLEILHTELVTHAAGLEAANLELEAFNYSASHDLRGPLTVIASYCGVVEELYGNKLDGQGLGYLREIHESAMRMSRLLDTLLRFSRVKHAEIRHDKVDLSKIAEEVATGLKMVEPGRRVTFRIAAGLVADGDAVLLRVVLHNLMDNALKYSVRRDEAVIEFDMTMVDGKPVYFIRDNGPGFDMVHAEKLFMPFQRLPGTDVGGTGIGLATVDRIVKRHGGKIWTESQPGEGATFFFTLE